MIQLKVLVTGSEGFVGKRLCKNLSGEGTEVVKGSLAKNSSYNVPKSNIDGIDVLVHLAARTSVLESISKPYEIYHANILGTLWALETARINNIKRIIYLSSYVYGQPDYLPVDEKHKVNPESPYHKSKYVGEKLCNYYFSDFGINIVILRTFTLYGPGSKSYQAIPHLINQIYNSGQAVLSSDTIRRDFLFVDDFVKLLISIIRKFPLGYNIYNVGSGKSFALIDIAHMIGKFMRREIRVTIDRENKSKDIKDIVADISKVQNEFEWVPLMGLLEGLQIVIEDYKKNTEL